MTRRSARSSLAIGVSAALVATMSAMGSADPVSTAEAPEERPGEATRPTNAA